MASGGLIGQTLDAAQRSEFFQWFHLMPDGPERSEAGQARRDFRPSGKSFHDLVQLSLWLGREGIQQARLSLDRRFIDDPRQSMFARDIAKSFLRGSIARADAPDLATLADEIEFDRTGVGVPVLVGAGRPRPKLPSTPTPGYLVFLGRMGSHEIRWPAGRSVLKNTDEPQGPFWQITVTASPR